MANAYANDGLGFPFFADFGNPGNRVAYPLASATTITPMSLITVITGSAQIQNINLPWPGFEGDIKLIFTDVAPGATLIGGTTGIAIQLATTVVRYKTLTMTYVQSTGLWYPSY